MRQHLGQTCGSHISETVDGFIPFEVIWTCSCATSLSFHLHLGLSRSNLENFVISGMEGSIDMERKGCESIGCYTHIVTFNFGLNHDLDRGFARSNFEKVVSQEWDGQLTWNERDMSR